MSRNTPESTDSNTQSNATPSTPLLPQTARRSDCQFTIERALGLGVSIAFTVVGVLELANSFSETPESEKHEDFDRKAGFVLLSLGTTGDVAFGAGQERLKRGAEWVVDQAKACASSCSRLFSNQDAAAGATPPHAEGTNFVSSSGNGDVSITMSQQ